MRLAVVCGVLGCAVFAGLAPPGAAHPVPRHFQLGKFAGYVWESGAVTSVSASWTVPRIVGSRQGQEATWIGAEGPPPGPPVAITAATRLGRLAISPAPSVPFIQVGTQVTRIQLYRGGPLINRYESVWSDTDLGYVAQALGTVRPGDEVSASLTLAAHRWIVSISDRTTHVTRSFTTTDQGHGRFNEAEWLEEDVLPGRDGNPAPLVSLSPTRITQLAVDAKKPRYQDLQSLWMSENGRYLGPGAFSGDVFGIGEVTLRRAGIAYLDLADLENRAAKAFGAQLARWTPATSRSRIVSECSDFARALRRSLHSVATGRWPAAASRAIGTLERRTRALLALTNSGLTVPPPGLAAWRMRWRASAMAAHAAGLDVRRTLHVPEHVSAF